MTPGLIIGISIIIIAILITTNYWLDRYDDRITEKQKNHE